MQLTFLPIFQLALTYPSSERGSLFFYLCTKILALKSDICVFHTNIWTTNILFLSPQNNVSLISYSWALNSPSELGILNATSFSLNLWYCILKSSDKTQIQCKVHSVYFVINFNLWFCFYSWSKNAQQSHETRSASSCQGSQKGKRWIIFGWCKNVF